MEMPVLVRILKSSILSSTSFQKGKTFWGVVSAAVDQSRRKANMVIQRDGKFWAQRLTPESLPTKKNMFGDKRCVCVVSGLDFLLKGVFVDTFDCNGNCINPGMHSSNECIDTYLKWIIRMVMSHLYSTETQLLTFLKRFLLPTSQLEWNLDQFKKMKEKKGKKFTF